jgi:hypothetical protein
VRNPKISNFMKTHPVGAELFHIYRQTGQQGEGQTDEQMDRHDEAKSNFCNFVSASETESYLLSKIKLLSSRYFKQKEQCNFSHLSRECA